MGYALKDQSRKQGQRMENCVKFTRSCKKFSTRLAKREAVPEDMDFEKGMFFSLI